MIYELKQPEKAVVLFEGWQETLIWSCLQGVMGKIYADSSREPVSAMALLGDFCFLAGRPDKELVLYEPEYGLREFVIMVPQNEEWEGLIGECYGENAKKVIRYAIKKEPDIFDRVKLQMAADGLPAGYVLKRIDEELFWKCKETAWCRDWVRQYDDYTMFQKYGAGVVAMKDGQPVSGASSYSGYLGGIEIEIDTRKDHRRRGLAYVCGARLILDCLKKGWYPSWDAQNLESVALAEKLGYHMDHEYTAFEVVRKKGI